MESRKEPTLKYLNAISGVYIARRLLDLDGLLVVPLTHIARFAVSGTPGVVTTASGHRLRCIVSEDRSVGLVPVRFYVPVSGEGGAMWTWLDRDELERWTREVNAVVEPVPRVVIEPVRGCAFRFLR